MDNSQSIFRNSQRLPVAEYQQNGILLSPSQVQQHLLMPRTHPPQLQTSPSYASTRSVTNRSVFSANQQSVRCHSPATYEAERISVATSQAKAAARSILLAGGTQASALTTAKAAAKSALQTNLVPGEKPPLGVSQNHLFRNRRKNKQQAEIIASMALSAANESFGLSPLGGEVIMTRSRSGFPLERRDSDYPDDYTNFQSLAPSNFYGVSPSSYSPMVELQRLQNGGYQDRPMDQNQNAYRTLLTAENTPVPPVPPSSNFTPSIPYQVDPVEDQNTTTVNPAQNTELPKEKKEGVPLLRTLSLKEFFQRKPISVEKETPQPSSEEVKVKIPSEMPMPKSSNSVKGSNSMKANSKRDTKVKANSSPQSRRKQDESQLSSYSDCSASHTNSSAQSYGESTYDNTAEYTDAYGSTIGEGHRETTISVDTKTNNGSFFFGNMDPFYSTFSEVFSCTPEPCSSSKRHFPNDSNYSKKRQTRDESQMDSRNRYYDEDQRDHPHSNSDQNSPKSVHQAESDSLLHGIDIRSFEEAKEKKKNLKTDSSQNKKSKSNPSSMEQMVLKALVALSPKAASPPSRPKLNTSHLRQPSSSTKDANNKPKSFSYGKNGAKASLSKSSSSKEKVAESNSSNQQASSDDISSASEDSVTVNPAPVKEELGGGYKLRRFHSWFPRPKKTKE